jgi:flagellar hook-basal body protein
MGLGALHVARTGLDAQNFRMQVIANNLANVNTTGFKRDRASFETLAYQAVTTPGAPASGSTRYAIGFNLGTGVQMTGTARIDTQGTLSTTSNALDVAVEGAGYFQVQMPDGRTGYTRAGDFSISADGTLVTSDGMAIQPQIQIPETEPCPPVLPDRPRPPNWAASRLRALPMPLVCKRLATIYSSKPQPLARRRLGLPVKKDAVRYALVRLKVPTSMSSRSWSI